MDDFIKQYREIYDKEMIPRGFKRKINYYYRMMNNKVLHTISPQRDSLGETFVLNYGIWTMCSEFDRWLTRASIIRSDSFMEDKWIYGIKVSPDECKKALMKSMEITKIYVIPLFDRCVNYETFWNMFIEMSENYYQKGFLGALHDNCIFWVPIVLKRYDEAMKTLEGQIEVLKRNIKWEEEQNKKFEEKGIKGLEPVFSKRKEVFEYKERLEAKDYQYFDKLVVENEAKAFDIIKRDLKLKI